MTGGKRLVLAGTAMLAIAACGAEDKLEIRSIPTPLASGHQPVPARIAEGRSFFALNNVGLALEAFRKALRDDPNSVDAFNGIAACYDRMGRFDLSRRYYEMALAINPADPRLYANLAVSLDMQGKSTEAASVRAEMTQRMAAAASSAPAAAPALAAMPSNPPAIPVRVAAAEPVMAAAVPAPVRTAQATAAPSARSVTVALPAPAPLAPMVAAKASTPMASAPVAQPRPALAVTPIVNWRPAEPAAPVVTPRAAVPAAPKQAVTPDKPPLAAKGRGSVTVALAPPRPVETPSRARLERLSSGQVSLITSGRPAAKAPARLAAATTQKLAAAPIILLNAARHQGLAARTRQYLAHKGWQRIEIGDAPQVATRSVILYPAGRRGQAVRLAGQFGFALRHGPSSSDRLTILLGRDAAARRWLGTRGA